MKGQRRSKNSLRRCLNTVAYSPYKRRKRSQEYVYGMAFLCLVILLGTFDFLDIVENSRLRRQQQGLVPERRFELRTY